MIIILIMRDPTQNGSESRHVEVAYPPRCGEYLALWSKDQTHHDIYRVSAIVQHASTTETGNALLPVVIVDNVSKCVSVVAFYEEVQP